MKLIVLALVSFLICDKRSRILKFEYIVEYENCTDEFHPGPCLIKVKVTAGLQFSIFLARPLNVYLSFEACSEVKIGHTFVTCSARFNIQSEGPYLSIGTL